jgi:hypothetical protein
MVEDAVYERDPVEQLHVDLVAGNRVDWWLICELAQELVLANPSTVGEGADEVVAEVPLVPDGIAIGERAHRFGSQAVKRGDRRSLPSRLLGRCRSRQLACLS